MPKTSNSRLLVYKKHTQKNNKTMTTFTYIANTPTHLKCTGGNFVVHKERIHLCCNHVATGILNFDVWNVNVQSHDAGAITRQRIVENN